MHNKNEAYINDWYLPLVSLTFRKLKKKFITLRKGCSQGIGNIAEECKNSLFGCWFRNFPSFSEEQF